MHAKPFPVRHLGVDVLGVLKHLFRFDSGSTEERGGIVLGQEALMRHGIDPHRRAGLDAQHGRRARREIAPDNGLGGRAQTDVGFVAYRCRLRRRPRRKGEHAERGAPADRGLVDLIHWSEPLRVSFEGREPG